MVTAESSPRSSLRSHGQLLNQQQLQCRPQQHFRSRSTCCSNRQSPPCHGRRHSVNVLNKANQQQQQQQSQQQPQQARQPDSLQQQRQREITSDALQSSGPTMQANPDFSFPSTASAQRVAQAAYQPTQPTSGHFSRPSAQLTDLYSDYLMAGGGLVSLNSFGMGGSMNDLADGFGGAGAGGLVAAMVAATAPNGA